jgi:CheY-like chemotaxis protein
MGLFSKLFGSGGAPGASGSGAAAGKRILVVEPSITIQKVIDLTLAGSSVVTTSDTSQAKKALGGGRFDVVILAVVMPDMNGYDFCAYVKSMAGRTTPVLLLRGSFEPFDEERARRAGADGVVTKPFTPDALLAEIDRVLAITPAG